MKLKRGFIFSGIVLVVIIGLVLFLILNNKNSIEKTNSELIIKNVTISENLVNVTVQKVSNTTNFTGIKFVFYSENDSETFMVNSSEDFEIKIFNFNLSRINSTTLTKINVYLIYNSSTGETSGLESSWDFSSPESSGTTEIHHEDSESSSGSSNSGTTDSTSPMYSSSQINSTVAGNSILFSLYLSDETSLGTNGYYIFSTNNSGTWVNDSLIKLSGKNSWANVTKVLNSTLGTSVGYKWYFRDNSGNWNSTSTYVVRAVGIPEQSSIVAYYPFEGNANDYSGNGNNGNIYGGVSNDSSCVDGDCYSFDGINGYIAIPDLNVESGNFTISGWINLDNLTGTYMFFSLLTSERVMLEYSLRLAGSYYRMNFALYNGTYYGPYAEITRNETWHYFTFINSSEGLSLYLDGVLEDTFGHVLNQSPIAYTEEYIGSWHGTSSFFKGSMDEIRVWNTSLTSDDVSILYGYDVNTSFFCGNGILSLDEECDDRNLVAGDGCLPTCKWERICGNGLITSDEECDDGNTNNGDGCSSSCRVENNGICIDGTEPSDCSLTDYSSTLGLHYTAAEITIWQNRSENGPFKDANDSGYGNTPGIWDFTYENFTGWTWYPDVWGTKYGIKYWADLAVQNSSNDRFTNFSNGSVCYGPLSGNIYSPEYSSDGESILNAGFVYLLTGNESYAEAVRTELLFYSSQPCLYFSNRTVWPLNNTFIDSYGGFNYAPFLIKMLYAYDYTKSSDIYSVAEHKQIQEWFYSVGVYFTNSSRVQIFDPRFPGRHNDVPEYLDIPDSLDSYTNQTLWDNGPNISTLSTSWSNRRAHAIELGFLVGVFLGDDELINEGKLTFKEWIAFGTYSDGTLADHLRTGGFEEVGFSYSSIQLESLISIADVYARKYSNELYDFNVGDNYSIYYPSENENKSWQNFSASTNKSLYTLINTQLGYVDHTLNRTRDGVVIDGYNETLSRNFFYDSWYSQANIYYQDENFREIYLRIKNNTLSYDVNVRGYESFNWGGFGNVMPGYLFQWGDLENKIWPYVENKTT